MGRSAAGLDVSRSVPAFDRLATAEHSRRGPGGDGAVDARANGGCPAPPRYEQQPAQDPPSHVACFETPLWNRFGSLLIRAENDGSDVLLMRVLTPEERL